jgi:tetratricopeptide (TPR) repeat protein
MHQLYGDTI